jgi:hypothetical protein
MLKPLTIAAGKTVSVDVHGRFFRCRESSAEFTLRIGNETLTLEGGDENEALQPIQRLVFTNSNAYSNTVKYTAAMNVIRSAYVRQARTKMAGWDITLANGATQDFPGIATAAANYSAHGVPVGARRKAFIISTKPSLVGKILIFNKTTGKLLGVCPGGSAFQFENDDDIQIKNATGGAIDSTTADPDVAVAESFYA